MTCKVDFLSIKEQKKSKKKDKIDEKKQFFMSIFDEKIEFFDEKKIKKRSKIQFLGKFVWNKKVKK